MFSAEEREVIEKVGSLVRQADKLYQSLNVITQQKIIDYHIEGATLPYCLRWGLTATEELIEQDIKDNHNAKAKKFYG